MLLMSLRVRKMTKWTQMMILMTTVLMMNPMVPENRAETPAESKTKN